MSHYSLNIHYNVIKICSYKEVLHRRTNLKTILQNGSTYLNLFVNPEWDHGLNLHLYLLLQRPIPHHPTIVFCRIYIPALFCIKILNYSWCGESSQLLMNSCMFSRQPNAAYLDLRSGAYILPWPLY